MFFSGMRFLLLRPLSFANACRYDGPVPALAVFRAGQGSGLLERLAAESGGLAARRRRQLTADHALADRPLGRHVRSLAGYRHQAVALRGG